MGPVTTKYVLCSTFTCVFNSPHSSVVCKMILIGLENPQVQLFAKLFQIIFKLVVPQQQRVCYLTHLLFIFNAPHSSVVCKMII